MLWYIFQPLLFGLIGTEIDLWSLQPFILVWGCLVLLIGLIVSLLNNLSYKVLIFNLMHYFQIRVGVTYLVVQGAGLNVKERLFVAIAWIPKATVQAAIGPIALDSARALSNRSGDEEDLGLKVLTIAILSILITAPIGSIAISLLGPKLLTSDPLKIEKIDDAREEDCSSVKLLEKKGEGVEDRCSENGVINDPV